MRFLSEVPQTRPVPTPQVAELHQENQPANATVALGCVVAPDNAERSTTHVVLGALGRAAAVGRAAVNTAADNLNETRKSTGGSDKIFGHIDNAIFLVGWFTNGRFLIGESDDRYYTDGDRLAELLKISNGIEDALEAYKTALGGGYPVDEPFEFNYDTLTGYKDVLLGGFLNPAELQIGGFIYTITNKGNGVLNIHIVNHASIRSLLGQSTTSKIYNSTAGRVFPIWDRWPIHTRDGVPMGGNIRQEFDITVPVP